MGSLHGGRNIIVANQIVGCPVHFVKRCTHSSSFTRSASMMSNPLWFKDAVVYELHVKTFQDSDGDGVGDFRGLIERLDYFTELGVTALWLLPFYPSPLKDDGYDIADYFA